MTSLSAPHQFMALDVLTEILARANNPGAVAPYVTTTMRELTGARAVCLCQWQEAGPAGTSRVLDVCPERRRRDLPSAVCTVLSGALQPGAPALWLDREGGPDAAGKALAAAGFVHAVVVRLAVADDDVGTLLFLDLPEGAERVDEVLQFLAPLATLVALVLRNALLFERQEALIAERTRQIRESEARYRQLFEDAPYGIAIAEIASGRLVDVNPRMAEMAGRPRQELIGQPQAVLHSPGETPAGGKVSETFAAHREMPDRVLASRLRSGPGGDSRDVEIKAAVTTLDGRQHLLGFFHDVTARNRSLAELQDREAFISLLLASTAEAIYGLDAEGRCTFANQACLRLLGYSRESDLLGQSMHDRVHHSHADGAAHPAAECRVQAALRGGKQIHAEHDVFWRADGSPVDVEYWCHPILEDGSPKGAVVTFFDVSARLAEQRERAALQEQLRQRQKMEAVGALAGGIAHDFNNILAAILGYAELAQQRVPPDSDLAEDLGEVVRAGERARELVKQILTFSRKGGQTRRPVQAHLVVGEALRLLRQAIPANIPIEAKLNKEGDTILADPTQLHQVVMNLCTNAYQALRGGGTLSVSLEPVEVSAQMADSVPDLAPGPHVRLAVSDTGVGMDPVTLSRACEPFFTTKAPGEGTGMGLAVVHGIVRGSGGAMRIESTMGEGSRVEVYLPRHLGAAHSAQAKQQAVPGGVERVLVVDDEPALARMTEKLLERLGYRARSVTSSTAALELFLEDPANIDLVLTDQTMPGMTGDVLTQKLLAVRPDLPVILCTGYSERLDAARAAELGARGFLQKPLQQASLAAAIRAALDDATG